MAYFITFSTSGLKYRSGEGGAEVISDGCDTSLNVLARANFFDGFSLKGELRYSTKSCHDESRIGLIHEAPLSPTTVALRRGGRGMIRDSETGLKTPVSNFDLLIHQITSTNVSDL